MASDEWNSYLEAARRKVAIAAYHRDCLERELSSPALTGAELPPIGVQAHFEGVVFSVMAAVDQVAQATNSALRLGLPLGDLVNEAFATLGEQLPKVRDWFDDKIGRDLRVIRVRAVHYSYTKNPAEHRWRVESAERGRDYGGSRELLDYATAGAEYGARLGYMIDAVGANLTRRAGGVPR